MDIPYRLIHLCGKCTKNGFNLKDPGTLPGCEYYIPTCMVLECPTICLECIAIESMLRHERQSCFNKLHDIKKELKKLAIVTARKKLASDRIQGDCHHRAYPEFCR